MTSSCQRMFAGLLLATTISVAPLLVAPEPAYAQQVDAASDRMARAHFESGLAYYSRGDYGEAIRAFQEAYDISRRPQLLHNLYLSHERLGQFDEAIGFLRRFLAEAENIPTRATLEARLANLEARRAEAPPDGEPPPNPDPAPGPEPESEPTPDLTPEPEPEPDPTPEPTPDPTPVTPDSGGANVVGIVSIAVAGAGAVLFGVLAALAKGESADLASDCGADAGRRCTDDEVSSLERYTLLADIGLGVTVLGALSAVLFYTVFAPDDESAPSVAVAPAIGPTTAGVQAQVRF